MSGQETKVLKPSAGQAQREAPVVDPIALGLRNALNPGLIGKPEAMMTKAMGADIGRAIMGLGTPEGQLESLQRLFGMQQEIAAAWWRLWTPLLRAAEMGTPLADPRPVSFFISHAKRDEAAVTAFRARLDACTSSYVDWVDDPGLDRGRVDAGTAERLREKMRASKALVLLLSAESARSYWVQWEIGFFDALRGNVFIVPLSKEARAAIARLEYLRLYPMLGTPEELFSALQSISAR